MKNVFYFLFLLTSASFAQTDEEQVKQVVTSAYIEGIQNGGSIESIRKGFHPSFVLFRLIENEVKSLTLEEWITNIEKGRSQNSQTSSSKTEGKFLTISVVGPSAHVALELYRNEKKIFTDQLLLYKLNDGWRIVSKAFYRHP